jgi:2-polyprenyl-6-methoxyphenol hydroxylase-like FAD-dependent oxidoreductase
VRCEWLAPWGVSEAQRLGLLDVLEEAGAHYTRRHVPYADFATPEEAEARCIDLTAVLPGVPGAINVGHPRMCEAFDAAAQAAGARLLRGVTDLDVTPGAAPKAGFTFGGRRHEVAPRVVIGADGRGSSVARRIGARVNADPTHHIIAGLLVEGAGEWPGGDQAMGVHGGATLLVFPQSGHRRRLYLCHALSDRKRFGGDDGARNFLAAFRVPSLPFGDALAEARPVGPCHGYPNGDTWIDDPTAPGVVLVGDAAGHNDPTIGRGSASRCATCGSSPKRSPTARWSAEAYAEERRERMRRLRFVATLVSGFNAEFTDEARRRRQAVAGTPPRGPGQRAAAARSLEGPSALPARAFSAAAQDRLLGG